MAGHAGCARLLSGPGFATGLGLWYALILLSHSKGRLGADNVAAALGMGDVKPLSV